MDLQTEQERIRLVLVDAQALFRTSLSRFLAAQPDLAVAGECSTSAEALRLLADAPVDIALLDLDLRTGYEADLISAARRAGYKGHFLVVAGSAGAKELADAIKLGASGIFLKSEAPERLVQAIRMVASGAMWIDPKAIQLLADQLDRPRPVESRPANVLTDREERVLSGIVSGLTNRKIGDNMGLSEGTVKSVVQQLFFRAGVRTRSQLVRMALDGSLGAVRELLKREVNGAPDGVPSDSQEIEEPIAANPVTIRRSPA
jgi:two-component system, NarL family, nitrate/nitrite response regulator NarL